MVLKDKNILKAFVYGTLKVGGHFASYFDAYRIESVTGKVKGRLFNAGAFPAAVHGKGQISGELHTYKNGTEILSAFDQIEGFDYEGSPGNLYNREIIEVETENGTEEAIMYFFNGKTENLREIKEGVWKM